MGGSVGGACTLQTFPAARRRSPPVLAPTLARDGAAPAGMVPAHPQALGERRAPSSPPRVERRAAERAAGRERAHALAARRADIGTPGAHEPTVGPPDERMMSAG